MRKSTELSTRGSVGHRWEPQTDPLAARQCYPVTTMNPGFFSGYWKALEDQVTLAKVG